MNHQSTVAEAGTSPLILQEIQPNLKPFPNTASVSESTSTQAPWQSQATGRTKHSVTETDTIDWLHKTDAHFFVLNWQALLRQNLLYSFFSLHAFPFFKNYACWLFCSMQSVFLQVLFPLNNDNWNSVSTHENWIRIKIFWINCDIRTQYLLVFFFRKKALKGNKLLVVSCDPFFESLIYFHI